MTIMKARRQKKDELIDYIQELESFSSIEAVLSVPIVNMAGCSQDCVFNEPKVLKSTITYFKSAEGRKAAWDSVFQVLSKNAALREW